MCLIKDSKPVTILIRNRCIHLQDELKLKNNL